MEYPFLEPIAGNQGGILQKVYKKRKITAEKTVKVAIPILKKLWYTECCFKRELNDKR
jgi:hypothetical protein